MEYDSLSRCLGGEMADTRDSKSRAKERGVRSSANCYKYLKKNVFVADMWPSLQNNKVRRLHLAVTVDECGKKGAKQSYESESLVNEQDSKSVEMDKTEQSSLTTESEINMNLLISRAAGDCDMDFESANLAMRPASPCARMAPRHANGSMVLLARREGLT
ncbi:hypothetical protein HAX54_052536 [Datura stramonium]|uniref:Uncharacterized protein n=1 Tax=Datura stramonium TaxID=4076 RepID=A0ABS8T1C8_DATST|nr:hypothetical protein [Datura stramonium]